MTFGSYPFGLSDNLDDMFDKIINEKLRFPKRPKVSGNLKDMLRKLLKKNPKRRIRIEEIKVHPWVLSNFVHEIGPPVSLESPDEIRV